MFTLTNKIGKAAMMFSAFCLSASLAVFSSTVVVVILLLLLLLLLSSFLNVSSRTREEMTLLSMLCSL